MDNLLDNQYLVFHYSSIIFNEFNKDKADGFWFTDINPENTDMLDEIGANSSSFCAKCIITIDNEIDDINNYDVFEQLAEKNTDGAICRYDGFIDYVVASNSQIKILEWIEL